MKQLTKDKLVIYHGSCDDGFGGALAFNLAFGKDADYYAGYYGDPLPDVTGKEVYIVDFSYSEEEIYRAANTAKKLVWLDHHASIQELAAKVSETTDKDKVTVEFDNNRSGARIAYDYLLSVVTDGRIIAELDDREWFFDYIQDNDLWTFKLSDAKAFSLAVRSYKQDFNVWYELSMPETKESLFTEGRTLQKFWNAKVDEITGLAYEKTVLGHKVYVANCNGMFASDAGNAMCQGKPFSVTWWYDGKRKQFVFSLRSDNDGLDVGELAKSVGGGGHKHAAGFKLPPDKVDSVIDLE